jgi:tetratricopeptide (TPR) repeat protein
MPLTGRDRKDRQDLQEILDRATSLHQQGQLSEAAALYRQALASAPGHPRAQYLLAFLLYQQGKGAEALASVNAVLQKSPALADALMLRGAILQQQNPKQALDDFQSVTRLQPHHAEAWYNQGVLLAQLGQNPDAVSAFDRALHIRPAAATLNNKGTVLLAMGRSDEALASFTQALVLDKGFTGTLYNQATTLLQLQRLEEGLAAFDKFLQGAPEAFEAWNNRGVALQALTRHEEALESYRRALTIRSDYTPAWKNSGLVLTALERHAEAAVSFTKAASLSPGDAEVWSGQGRALSQLKQYDEALVSCEKALALVSDDANVWSQYGGILRTSQRFGEALTALEKALALAPEHLEALETQAAMLCELSRIPEGLESYMRRAALIYGGETQQEAEPAAHKKRHDLEQQAWLADHGVNTKNYHILGGERLASRALNAADIATVSAQWQSNQPQIIVIDNLLTDEALQALRQFCWGSTIWKKSYSNGYLGAMQEHGFASPLLAQIADELRDTYPAIFGAHGLLRVWGFKYDSTLRGIRLHADQAVVNVNFWITPDSANRNPDNGGLVIWDKSAPLDWDFRRYNNSDETAAREFLMQAGAKPLTVPYRANRAVIFDSDLFHETDGIEFEEGYLNRRINVTMLYGRRTFDGG